MEESKEKYNNKIDLFNLITIILFVILSLTIGHFHEPWSDEAQSWLIAREQNIKDIFCYNSKYEGTFPLWILTLKFFLLIGFKYEFIYVISTMISSLGVIVLLYKTNLPKIYKIFFIFNFYTIYQYTVVARSYCYFILAFACLIALYDKRHTQIIKYFFNLILFSFISLHGMVISGILALFYFIEIIKEFKSTSKKNNLKKIICIGVLAIVYIFEIAILIPAEDVYVDLNHEMNIKIVLKDICGQIVPYNGNYFIKTVCSFGVVFICVILFKFRKYLKKEFIIMMLSILALYIFVRCAPHHLGILFFVVITQIFLISHENVKTYIYALLIIYVLLAAITGVHDIGHNYSGAKELANYIKNIENYEEKNIYGIGYKCTAILPYFEKNIFNNRKETYYLWSKNNLDLVIYDNALEIDFDKMDFNDELPEYIVLQNHDISVCDGRIKYVIGESGKYELIFETSGKVFFKGSHSETESYYLYRLK